MIADLPPPPVETRQSAPAEATYGIAASGKAGDLVKLQQIVEAQGWKARWMVVPGKSAMLFIVVLPSTPSEAVTALLGAINSKKMGDLSAGLARVGGDD